MTAPVHAASATHAAWLLADCTAELLRFAQEGNGGTGIYPFVEAEVIGKLCEALVRTATIEREALTEHERGPNDDGETLDQLIAACRKAYWDWTGSELVIADAAAQSEDRA